MGLNINRKKVLDTGITAGLSLSSIYSAYILVTSGFTIEQAVITSLNGALLVFYLVFSEKKPDNARVKESDIDSKEAMVAALAHEIKNPLNSIKGANKFLHDKHKNDSQIAEFTTIIGDEVERLEKYLREFMSFSRGINLRIKKVNLHTFVTGVVMTVKHGFENEIQVANPVKKLPPVSIDQEQMRQVLVNLLNNAKAAIKNADNPRVVIELDHDQSSVSMVVKDNGKGIDKKDLEKIFTPFYTTGKEGLGLGLSICRAIVRRHGGAIEVKSEKGRGSVFIVRLPRHAGALK